MAKQLIDLSHPLEAGTPPWPGAVAELARIGRVTPY